MLSHNSSIKVRYMLLSILITGFYVGDAQLISKITMAPIKVIYVVDTATTNDEIALKMGKDYGMLFRVIGQQQLVKEE
jgi:hypothetical protein